MKKAFIVVISLILALSISACSGNKTDSPDALLEDPNDYVEEPDEEQAEDIEETKPTSIFEASTDKFERFYDAQREFDNHVFEASGEIETTGINPNLVMITDMKVFDYMLPLHLWGETLDDKELAEQDIATSVFEGEEKGYRRMDLERESENRYKVIIETHDDELIITKIEYYPDIDALRLETVDNGSIGLIFEYVKTKDGYAAQYYFDSVIAGTYGVLNTAMCVFKAIFSGYNGSLARFEDVEEPPSIIGNVPKEEDFIQGASDWLTIKDGSLTGQLYGNVF